MRIAPPVLLALALLPVPFDRCGAAPEGGRGAGAALLKLGEAWLAAADDAGRAAVEAQARALPPPEPGDVDAIAEGLFALWEKRGRRLSPKARAYFYDEKEKRGLYILKPGRKGGGLMISMHGGGEGVGAAGDADSIWGSATSAGFTVISPEVMKKVSSAWNEEPEERFVLELIDAAVRTFDCDTDRVVLAGHSMGGDGSWMIGGRNADRIAAAAPLAGSVMPYMKPGALNRLETPRAQYQGLMEGVLPNLMHVPYWIHHSDDDRNEAIHPDDIATGHLKSLQERFPGRYAFHYDRVTGNGHALPKGGVKPIVKWLAEQKRTPYPKEVVWETWWRWKTRFHWLRSAAHDEAWRFHARITGPNRVDVSGTTKPLPGKAIPKEMPLTILLSPELFDLAQPLVITSGGKVLHEGPAPVTAWALLATTLDRGDRKQWFRGHVDVVVPRRTWWDLWEDEPAAAR